MPKQPQEMGLLLKALEDLEDFLPHLVLVGGWVPLLYTRYLWHGDQEPLLTFDIDFGVRKGAFRGKETIADRVLKKRWGEHHVRLGHDTPFVPVVKLQTGLKAEVEFIAAPGLPEAYQEQLIGREIRLNTIEDFDILFEKVITIKVERFSVTVPAPAIFVFHKLLTFNERRGLEKRKKDLYYAYYVLLVSPDQEGLEKDVRSLIKNHSRGDRVKKNIESYFEDALAEGPAAIAQGSMTSSIPMLVSDVPEDAFNRIGSLVND